MADMAIDVLDRNWRLMVGQTKPCTHRGARFSRCNPRRARGDACGQHTVLEKHGGKPRREGSCFPILDRIVREETSLQLSDPVSDDEEPTTESRGCGVLYRRQAQRFVKLRRKEEQWELDKHERAELMALEAELKQRRDKYGEQLPKLHSLLQDCIADLESRLIQTRKKRAQRRLRRQIVETQLELYELEILGQYTV